MSGSALLLPHRITGKILRRLAVVSAAAAIAALVAAPAAEAAGSSGPVAQAPDCRLVTDLSATGLDSFAVGVADKLTSDAQEACAPVAAARLQQARAAALVTQAEALTAAKPPGSPLGRYLRAATLDGANATARRGLLTSVATAKGCTLARELLSSRLVIPAQRVLAGTRPSPCREDLRGRAQSARKTATRWLGVADRAADGSTAQTTALIRALGVDATLEAAQADLGALVSGLPAQAAAESWPHRAGDGLAWLGSWVEEIILPILVLLGLAAYFAFRRRALMAWTATRRTPPASWFAPRLRLRAADPGSDEMSAAFVDVVTGQIAVLTDPHRRLPAQLQVEGMDAAALKGLTEAIGTIPTVGRFASALVSLLSALRPGPTLTATVRLLGSTSQAGPEGVALAIHGPSADQAPPRTVYAHDYDPLDVLRREKDELPDEHLRCEALAAAAAVWIVYSYARIVRRTEGLERALGTEEWRSAARQRAGLEWLLDREVEQAHALFAAALDFDDRNRIARLDLGVTHLAKEQFHAAEKHFENALARSEELERRHPEDAGANRDRQLQASACLGAATAICNTFAAERAAGHSVTSPGELERAHALLDRACGPFEHGEPDDGEEGPGGRLSSICSSAKVLSATVDLEFARLGSPPDLSSVTEDLRALDPGVYDERTAVSDPGDVIDGRSHYNLGCAYVGVWDAGGSGKLLTLATDHLAAGLLLNPRLHTGLPTDPALAPLRNREPDVFGGLCLLDPRFEQSELAGLPGLSRAGAAALSVNGVARLDDVRKALGTGDLPTSHQALQPFTDADRRWMIDHIDLDELRLLAEIGITSRTDLLRWMGHEKALVARLALIAAKMTLSPPPRELVTWWLAQAEVPPPEHPAAAFLRAGFVPNDG